MEKIAVSEFRANMVSLLKKVEKGEVFTLTSRGHEVAKIVPPDDRMEEARKTLRHLRKTNNRVKQITGSGLTNGKTNNRVRLDKCVF